ncbi:MAG TPA: tetratricopeptide repeat-containing protein, partial [Blastocatellia bacterium]|nr:tetratricopeptide repeat-containing protein [Blastocatellia bacterium]
MANNQMSTSNKSKRCFIVMGFGKRIDYATGRRLDLDKTYRDLIKPVVKKRGLKCIRADEITHSQIIDVPMYQELLTADVVIADLSTANPNAIYELGIRHALRPWTTIVISENKLPYPFDVNHVRISSYTHLGDAIDYEEVIRFRKVLRETLDQVLKTPETDSPVYTFLKHLSPPVLKDAAAQMAIQSGQSLEASRAIIEAETTISSQGNGHGHKPLAKIIKEGEQAIDAERFSDAKNKFTLALQLIEKSHQSSPFAPDPYLIQRLVLATFKAKQPDRLSALFEARNILDSQLNLKDSNDPETVGLASSIEKQLFDISHEAEHLDRAIRYSARGYFLRGNRYNGIYLAFLLNVRADCDERKEHKIADLVWANRIRLEVLELCEQEMNEICQREKRRRNKIPLSKPDKLYDDIKTRDKRRKFWCLAAKAEAYFGLGELDNYEKARAEALKAKPPNWRMVDFNDRIKRLRESL